MLIAFDIVVSSFKDFNNMQELTIINLIPNLYWNHLFKRKKLLSTMDRFQIVD